MSVFVRRLLSYDIKHNRKIYPLLKQDSVHNPARSDYSALIRALLCTLVLVMIYFAVKLGIAVYINSTHLKSRSNIS